MKRIDIPGVGLVDFPDSMTDAEISSAIETDILKTAAQPESVKKESGNLIKDAASYIGKNALKLPAAIADQLRNKSVVDGMDGKEVTANPRAQQSLNEVLAENQKTETLKPGAKIVDSLPGIAEVGFNRGYAGLGRVEAGLIKAAADLTGSESLGKLAESQNRYADEIEGRAVLRGTPVEGFAKESIVQDLPEAGANAIASVMQTAPSLVVGAATGGSGLPAMFGSVALQEYNEGRNQDKTPLQSAFRAAPMAGAEVLGEKLGGFEKLSKGLRNAVKGNGVADLGAAMIESSLRELPSEELTTTLQFLIDKTPEVGLNQGATFDDYKKAVKDTALATILQSSGMGVGGAILTNIANKLDAPKGSAEALEVEDAIISTLERKYNQTNATQETQPKLTISQGNNAADEATAAALQAQYDAETAKQEADAALAAIPEATSVDDAIKLASETIKAPIESGTGLLGQINQYAAEAIPAADILGSDNVSDLQNDVSTELANSTIEGADNNAQGSVGNLSDQPTGRDDTGRTDNAAGTLAQSSGADISTGNAVAGNDAVNRPFAQATDEFLPQMRNMTVDPTVIKQIDDELALRGLAGPATVPAETKQPETVLQNRDRSQPESINQMRSIAANPDPSRLSFSRDAANGAPVVAGQLPASAVLGKLDHAITANNRKLPMQYAVVEASDVIASHDVNGNPIAEYGKGNKLQAIGGNGRIAGLQEAFRNNNGTNYIQGIAEDSALHGVPADAIRSMKNPVLIRVMNSEDITPTIGDELNGRTNMGLSVLEQAKTDTARLKLEALDFNENGEVTQDAIKAFVMAMPENERNELMDGGRVGRKAEERLMAAVFNQAYGDDELVRIYSQAQDIESKAVITALANAAPTMARLTGAGNLDIRSIVANAAKVAVNSSREGVSLAKLAAQGDMELGEDVMEIVRFMAQNIRRPKLIGEELTKAAQFAYDTANQPTIAMFDLPNITRDDVIRKVANDYQTGPENLAEQGRGQFDGSAARNEADNRAGQENSETVETTNAGQQAQVTDNFTLSGQTNEDINAGIAAQEAAAKAARDQAKADEAARIEAERIARQEIAADSFDLTPTGKTAKETQANDAKQIDNQFAGQSDLLAAPQQNVKTNQDEVIYNGVRLYKIKVKNRVEGQPPIEMWAVESAENKSRREKGERTIGGDTLTKTIDEAKAEADFMLKREAQNKQSIEAEAKRAAEQAEKERQEAESKSNLDGFGAELDALNLGKVKETLNKPISIKGVVLPLRDMVRKLIAEGGKPQITQENVYKGMTRAQYNRADNRQQEENDRKIREGGKKNVYNITMPDGGMYELGKIAHDFAEHLIAKKNSNVTETNFGNMETIANQPTPESKPADSQQAIEAIKQDDTIPTAEKIKLAADLRNGNVTAEDVKAIVGDVKQNDVAVPDYAGMRKALNKLGYPNSDLSRNERRVTIDSKAIFAKDQFTVDIMLKDGKWSIFEPSTPNSYTEEQGDAMEKFRRDLSVLNGEVTEQGAQLTDQPELTSRITDFGEKLEGAKKDLWQTYKKSMSDELPSDLTQITLAKHYPEPDYDNLIASGLEVKAIAAIKAMRDEIPAKPRMPSKLRRWANELSTLREFANKIIDGKYSIEQILQMMRERQPLQRFVERIELYADLGFPAMKSAKGYNITSGWTSFDRNNNPEPGKKTAIEYPNGKREYFNDRETALAALRQKLEIAPESTEKKTKLDVYKVTTTGEIVIGKKVASNKYIDLKGGFKNAKEAFQYYADNEAQLLELLEQRKNFKPERRSANNPRVGTDYRLGEDVTPEKFAAEFGFRGVQFGNYVEQSRRNRDLNNAYDALLDLASIINVPPRAISLNGSLGLAFGARGSGGKNAAAAHYERDQVVINLTKVNGFGSLGHEWFHALDNYFSKARGDNEYLTQKPTQKRIYQAGAGFSNDESIRPEVLAAFKNLMDGIKNSDYYTRSVQRDNTRTKDYWGTAEELAARAFEAYLIAKSKEAGKENDYLANIEDEDVYEIANQAAKDFGAFEDPYPYPTRAEQEAINPLFDALFGTLKTKEADNGNVMFFSRINPNVSLQDELQSIIDGNNPAKGNVLTISENSPASLQMFGFNNLPVVTRTGADGVLKMHYEHGLSIPKLANVIENGLKRPAMILQHKGQGDVESLRFVTNEMHNGNPVILAIQPEKQSATGRVQLIATAFEVNAETIARDIKNGNLLYRDTNATIPGNIKKGVTQAQIKYAREPRSLLGVIPNSAPSRRHAYKILSQSDIVKFESNNENSYFSRTNQPIFYSQLSRAIAESKQDNMPAKQWAAWLNANAGKLGVKKDEIQWTGITDWLDLQQGKLSKADIQAYLDANGVQVTETVMSDLQTDAYDPSNYDNLPPEVQAIVDMVDNGELEEDQLQGELNKIGYQADFDLEGNIEGIKKIGSEYNPTKYAQYTVPGGKNYKELLLTLPENSSEYDKAVSELEAFSNRMKEKYGENWKKEIDGQEDLELDNLLDNKNKANVKQQGFKSSHWSESNILAHVRFDERADADGNRVLFIHELQSDWNAEGRKKGFGRNAQYAPGMEGQEDGFIGLKEGVPEAPFVTETKSYLTLALKRMVRYAAENGFDKVAIINGQQAADLYDLSKQVNSITAKKWSDNNYGITAKYPNGQVQVLGEFTKDKLPDVVGKELAERIINEAKDFENETVKTYSGLDLKVGGEGMRAFYDQIVPQVANDVLKKLGGGKVESINIKGEQYNSLKEDSNKGKFVKDGYIVENQLGFTITTELRAKALEGLPLFNRDNIGSIANQSVKSTDQALAEKLNRGMVRYFNDDDWSNAYEQADMLSSYGELVAATEAAFGGKLAAIRPTAERFNIFNGINYGGTNYININADVGFINIVGHEIGHDLKRDRPDLYKWYQDQLKTNLKDFDVYQERLNNLTKAGEKKYTSEEAFDELSNDFMGDALADPVFVGELAKANPSKFKALLKYVTDFLSNIAGKLKKKDLGSSKYFNDVEAMRKHLNKVLTAYSLNKSIEEVQAMQAPEFSREKPATRMNRNPSKDSGDTFLTAALEFTARNEGLFENPASDAKTVEGIAADTDTGFIVKPYGKSQTKLDKADKAWEIFMPNATYRSAVIYEKGDQVWINVSRLQSGVNFGSNIYSLAAAYAFNNNKIFIGDPLGLTDKAFYRRAENMLSSALKYGTTKHIAPHLAQEIPAEYYASQGNPEFGKSVRPINWIAGNDVHNIKELIYTVYKGAIDNLPELKNVIFNPDTQQFETVSGELFDNDAFERVLSRYYEGTANDSGSSTADGSAQDAAINTPKKGNPYRAGIRTAKRAALFNTFLREQSAERRTALLGAYVRELQNFGLADSLKGVFYSRSNPQSSLTPEWKTPDASKFDSVVYKLQDKNIDLKRVTQAIKDAGNEISDRWNAYLQEELYHGRTAKRTQEFLKNDLEPLITEMRMRGVAMADFEEYLWARHAEERNIQIAKVNPDMPDGGSGMTTTDARDYIANLSAADKSKYEALARRIDLINAKSRQVLIDYGLESAGTIMKWEGAYKHYVPLMREDMELGFGNGTGQGFSVKGNASKRATGSNRPVVDIIANIAQQYERNIIRGEKNRVATALIGLAKLNPNDDFWKVDTPPTIKSINQATGLVEERTDPNYKNRDNVVVARLVNKRGEIEERSVIFNQFDERAMRMAAAIKNLDQDQIGELLGTASSFTRYFASINTQYNPVFGVINITRDVQGALLNLSSTPLSGKQKEILANTGKAWLGIYKDLRQQRKTGSPSDAQWATLFEEFQREGGQTGYRDMYANAKERSEALKNALDPTWWKDSKIGKVISVNGVIAAPEQWMYDKAIKPIFDWLSDYNNSLENAVRLSVYKSALDAGQTKQQAASIAKNISVNFNRKGASGRQIGALYAFFNASVQGTARIAETVLQRDNANGKLSLSKAGKVIFQGGLLLGAMQALVLAAAGYDDDEPPEFVRDRSLIIPLDPIGADGKYVTIPMPLGYNAIPATGRMITEWALSGGEDTGKRIVKWMNMLLDVTNPIGNAGLSLQTITPTVIDPMAALAENKDFTGRPIAREDISSLDPTPGFTRSRDKALDLSVAIARGINWATGGTDAKQGVISPTADQLEYLAGQFTGGVGRETIKLGTTVDSLFTGEELPTYKIPLFGRFFGDTTGQSSQGSEFYNNIRKLNEHQAEIKLLQENDGDLDGYLQDNPEALYFKQADRVYRNISKLRKNQRVMKEQGADKADIKAIDEAITELMTNFNDAIREAKEKEPA